MMDFEKNNNMRAPRSVLPIVYRLFGLYLLRCWSFPFRPILIPLSQVKSFSSRDYEKIQLCGDLIIVPIIKKVLMLRP